jgi:hypothetical protein|tara:strand:+ start:582 stop:728 length:147 start_codon:yes stop_codon:yes gene_type:complete
MAYTVTARIRHGAKRIESRTFRTKAAAQRFADLTNKDRPGSNARVKKK